MAMKFKGLTLDPFQEKAVNAIEENHSVVVSAPTGSGKTLVAEYLIHKHRDDDKRIIYTAPIKALSNQKYKDFSEEFGQEKIGLMTGDIVINPTAKIVIMTTEIYRNMVLISDESIKKVAYVVFDEVHYINDIERGYVWEESIIYSPKTVRFLCLSATIPNAEEFSNWIQAIKGHVVQTVTSDFRVVPLTHNFYDEELGITDLKTIKQAAAKDKDIPKYGRSRRGKRKNHYFKATSKKPDHIHLLKLLGKGKFPCLFFNFSRKACQDKAKQLSESGMFRRDSSITSFANKRMKEWPSDVKKLQSTIIMKEALSFGIGFHHAGLLPLVKELVEDLFTEGKIKVLYATETFAVGINVPAKTVVFDALRKYDGISFRSLNTKEYFQIAGRAGRRGIDKEGFVVSMIYRPTFNYYAVKKLTYKDVDPIKSQFKLSINTVLNLIDQHPAKEIEKILRLSFFSYQKFGKKYAEVPTEKLLFRYNRVRKKLTKHEFVDKKGKLTLKGKFSSKIFVDEMLIGDLFATGWYKHLNEYQTLLLLGALVYEPKEKTKIFKTYLGKEYKEIRNMINESPHIMKLDSKKKLENLDEVTSFIHPIYNGKTFFDLMKNSNLLEGDLIRFFGQILDRIGQIKKATTDDNLVTLMDDLQGLIMKALEGIYLV